MFTGQNGIDRSRRGFLREACAGLLVAGGADAQSKKGTRLSRPYEKILVSPLVPDVTKYEVIARGPDRVAKELENLADRLGPRYAPCRLPMESQGAD